MLSELPDDVSSFSLGCGDPITLAALQPGQTVLDLGSGGGLDCFLASKRVGPSGHVIGVDMTPEMLQRARGAAERLGAANVEFRQGFLEALPVDPDTVDVVISNCVINLAPDKSKVIKEVFRVLKPGGKMAVSDIVTDGPLPDEVKTSLSAWAGCIAGALDVREYQALLEAEGFTQIEVTPSYFDDATIDEALHDMKLDDKLENVSHDTVSKTVFSARISARKP
jgi:ubiquinone/menaquinone biosynthesis C-methylase UbiE